MKTWAVFAVYGKNGWNLKSMRECSPLRISNDSLAKISHNYPYTANTVDLNITKAKGRGLAMFVRGVMPLDGISCLLIQMFLSGESEETAEIKARTITTTRQLYWMQRKYIILVHSHYLCLGKAIQGKQFGDATYCHHSALTHHAC